uniref:Uncharacterized protein n=1 Tax=Lepeophtheirus salmonis TaxID=72036 RepID=A0A0K2UKC8_LEPSM
MHIFYPPMRVDKYVRNSWREHSIRFLVIFFFPNL